MQRNHLKHLRLCLPFICFMCAGQSLVQSTLASSASLVASQSVSFGSTPTVGDIVVVAELVSNDSTYSTMADNQTNSYSVVESAPPGQAFRQVNVYCTSVLTASGTFTITATIGITTAFVTLFAAEYSGATCNPDQSTSGTALTASPYACGTMTTRNSKDLLISVLNWDGSGTVTFSINSSFSIEQQQTNGTLFEAGAYADRVVSSAGSFNPSWTVSANANATCVNIALEAPTGGGGGGLHAYPIL
jgi:hypothetical protein